MDELFQQIDRLRGVEARAALATLVGTRGTTPRKEGAKMWIGDGGRILGSVTIGGCVDAQVMAEAEEALAESGPRLLELALGDEDAWEIGLTCGGVIEVLVEPVALDERAGGTLELYETLRSHVLAGGAGALVTRLDRPHVGAKLLVLDDGRRVGTLGSAALDTAVSVRATQALASGMSQAEMVPAEGEPEDGVRCFVDVHGPPATLVIVGAGHVAMPLATLARTLGFRIVVLDGRPRLATRERFPDADEVLVGMPSELVRQLPLSRSAAVVLVAHDYKYELPVLRHVLTQPVGYVGMLGSRRRGETILKMLREEGMEDKRLAMLRVPIGLDLGSQSAAEIALAVLAEIVAARHGGTGRPLVMEKGGGPALAVAGPLRAEEPTAGHERPT